MTVWERRKLNPRFKTEDEREINVISTAYKIIKKLVPRNGFYAAYLNRSLDHWTGERLLAGFGDDGSERSMVRHRKAPGLLE